MDSTAHSVPAPATDIRATPRVGLFRRFGRAVRRLGPAGPIALIVASLPTIGALCLLGTLTTLAPDLRSMPGAPLMCALVFIVLGGLSLLPTYALSILAGWAFGFAIGFPSALTGIVGASLVAYGVARMLSGKRFVAAIDETPEWRALHAALLGGSFWQSVWIITLIRLAPFPPFSVTNTMLGAMHAKMSRYLAGTTLGLAPHSGVLVLAAAGLHQLSWRAAEKPWLLVFGAVAMVTVIVVIGRTARRALADLARRTAEQHPELQVLPLSDTRK